jgi:hypothetical protein
MREVLKAAEPRVPGHCVGGQQQKNRAASLNHLVGEVVERSSGWSSHPGLPEVLFSFGRTSEQDSARGDRFPTDRTTTASNSWAMTPSGIRGVLNDAISFYFADATLASAFVARGCAVSKVQTAIGIFQVPGDEPAPRVGAAPHRQNRRAAI